MPFEPTTPTSTSKSKSKSTHSLMPSPPRNRRDLIFGSAGRDGYGIVSAAGLNAWRRGPKRSRTPSVSGSVAEGRRGLGMGLEGTPGRKKFKRFSKSSKPSIGLQSTPKTAHSRSTLKNPVDPTLRTTLSELSSNLPSSVASASEPSETPEADSFAVGAETIVGEDVFGLTIGIDPDGTLRGVRPVSEDGFHDGFASDILASYQATSLWDTPTSSRPYHDLDLDEVEDWASVLGWEQALGYRDLLDEAQQTPSDVADVPRDELDADPTNGLLHYQHRYLRDQPDRTYFWDETIPIRDPTDTADQINPHSEEGFGEEFAYDADFVTMLDDLTHYEEDIPLNDTSFSSSRRRLTSEISMIRRRSSKEKIDSRPKTPRRPTSTIPSVYHGDLNIEADESHQSVELGRGLNISKLGLPPAVCHNEHHVDRTLSTASSPLLPSQPEVADTGVDPDLSLQSQVSDVEYAGRIPVIVENGITSDEPRWDEIETMGCLRSPNLGLFGFEQAERLIKGQRPRRYRATSEIETPPLSPRRSPTNGSLISSLSSSSSIFTQINTPKAVLIESDTDPAKADEDYIDWTGMWKGGGRKWRKLGARGGGEDDGETVHDSTARGKVKTFIEPEYNEQACLAKNARIAHYEDLSRSFTLHVEGGYFQ